LTTNDTPSNKSTFSSSYGILKKEDCEKIKKVIRDAQYRVLKNNRQRF
jgi:hypothetical protein